MRADESSMTVCRALKDDPGIAIGASESADMLVVVAGRVADAAVQYASIRQSHMRARLSHSTP